VPAGPATDRGRHDDQVQVRPAGGCPLRGEGERLVHRGPGHAVQDTDPDPDPRYRAPGRAPVDRNDDRLAQPGLVHAITSS